VTLLHQFRSAHERPPSALDLPVAHRAHRKPSGGATIAVLLALLMTVTAPTWGTDDEPPPSAPAEGPDYGGFLLSTPQIADPLRPLQNAKDAAKHLTIHSAVVGVADPLETQLGRVFDIQLSSLLRAFHARDYVLDGFALTWDADLAGDLRIGGRLSEDSTRAFQGNHRRQPSLLLFRRDLWRDPTTPGSEYFALFLVGESPTFGLHPEAFLTAAKCAAALNGTTSDSAEEFSAGDLNIQCTTLFERHVHEAGDWNLRVIGPAFSGSMESLALSLGKMFESVRLACQAPDLTINRACVHRNLTVDATSPSASVTSNDNVANWAGLLSGDAANIKYKPLAASLEDQLPALCKIDALDQKNDKGELSKIVILAEESSFGKGVTELLKASEDDLVKNACFSRIRVRMFPQNIAAVRGEQTRREEQSNASVSKLLPSKGRLLPLDLTEVGESIDRPPAYHRMLSSRSDELMLYQAFDAIRVYMQPAAVAIVATDVRDRLFLLNEVRKNLPTALPVLMEMDFLTAHPDYRSISRGSVVIPNGDTLIMLSRDRGKILLNREDDNTEYHVFPSDYSANMFRAALGLIDGREDSPESPVQVPSSAAKPYVTTLAGFQEFSDAEIQIGEQEKKRAPRSVLLAADSRLALENPFYLFVVVFGLSLFASAIWLFLFSRSHLVMVSPLRNCNPWKGVKEPGDGVPADTVAAPKSNPAVANRHQPPVPSALKSRFLSALLCTIGLSLMVIALYYVLRDAGDSKTKFWYLAHGRDDLAIVSLWLVYAALAIAGFWRMQLWQRSFDRSRSSGGVADPVLDGHMGSCPTRHNHLALPVLLAVLFVLVTSRWARGLITSVDPAWPSVLMTMTLLPVGAWFLAQYWTQARHWSELTLALNNAVDTASKNLNPANSPAEARWPSPMAIGELPQSPYSLQFRTRDLQAFGPPYSDAAWERDTRSLREGTWPFGDGRTPQFLRWQARLVAEMRFASVAIRSAAWCGILAPTAVLIGMEVYPPYDQRLQTTVSVTMIVLGFLLIMYQALRLERDPLLGRMFTLHGDKLSLGGAFSTLWPKLIAAAVILIPVFFPDLQTWLFNMIRSVNSLQ
jgi:hypothetical protein